MSYSACDFENTICELLTNKGYRVHNGNAETGETVDDESGDGWWFTWGAEGMSGYEVGNTLDGSQQAWADAAAHYFANTDIRTYRPTPDYG